MPLDGFVKSSWSAQVLPEGDSENRRDERRTGFVLGEACQSAIPTPAPYIESWRKPCLPTFLDSVIACIAADQTTTQIEHFCGTLRFLQTRMSTSMPPRSSRDADLVSLNTDSPPPSYSRRSPQLSTFRTVAFAFSCLGVVFSDIGTSPLYVISVCFPPDNGVPIKDDIIGVISAIVWSITLLPLIKYVSADRSHQPSSLLRHNLAELHDCLLVPQVLFALSFGSTEGEGGPFALFLQLFPRRCREGDADDDRELTKFDSKDVTLLEEKPYDWTWLSKVRWPLLIWVSSARLLSRTRTALTAPCSS